MIVAISALARRKSAGPMTFVSSSDWHQVSVWPHRAFASARSASIPLSAEIIRGLNSSVVAR